jgi:hypothetical protein
MLLDRPRTNYGGGGCYKNDELHKDGQMQIINRGAFIDDYPRVFHEDQIK